MLPGAILLSGRHKILSGVQWILALLIGVALSLGIGLSTYYWSATPAGGNPWYSGLIGIVIGMGGGIAIVADIADEFRRRN
jgi:hypothetical protein